MQQIKKAWHVHQSLTWLILKVDIYWKVIYNGSRVDSELAKKGKILNWLK